MCPLAGANAALSLLRVLSHCRVLKAACSHEQPRFKFVNRCAVNRRICAGRSPTRAIMCWTRVRGSLAPLACLASATSAALESPLATPGSQS